MREYQSNNTIYIDINDIRTAYKSTYCKGIRSNTQLLEQKKITDYVYGRIVDGELTITEKLSKKLGSTFINKEAVSELFETKESDLLRAPPLIEDKDLVFFKDAEGRVHNVPMRGTRTIDGIYFQVKGVMYLFEMPKLCYHLSDPVTNYVVNEHFVWFNMSKSHTLENSHNREMYLTYAGLRRVIEVSRSGVGYKFKKWIDEIVFSSLFGTKEQKVETFKKVLNVDADHLKAIMSKSPTDISCLYLIDIGVSKNGKRVYKYGFTCDVSRRFKEHMKRYGDDIKLETFILVPSLSLSQAEARFNNSISKYRYVKAGEDELICLCEEALTNIKNVFKSVSEAYCGNLSTQIQMYESQIKDLKYAHEIQMNSLKMENLKLSMTIDLKDRDIEILQLKLRLAEK